MGQIEPKEAQKQAGPGPGPTGSLWRVRGMYFSGTGTTEKVVTTAAAALAAAFPCEKAPDIDFTPPAAREQLYRFDDRDIVVFGVPVIAGRVPNVLLPFLNTLEGDGAMAVPVVLYGNRNFDDGLIELRDILEERGFYTIAAAAFIGEHSFSRVLAAGRPDAQDLEIAAGFGRDVAAKIRGMEQAAAQRASALVSGSFSTDGAAPLAGSDAADDGIGRDTAAIGAAAVSAEAVYEEFLNELEESEPIPVDGETPLRPYYKPRDRQGELIDILKVTPKLDASKCTKCGICVTACPMGSIKPEAPGIIDGICIKCCGCEKKCPEGALYFDDPGYLYHKEELELAYPDRKEPKLFL